MDPRLTELIKDIQILEKDIRQYYQRFGISLNESLGGAEKQIEKTYATGARSQYQMIKLAAMVIEEAENAKGNLLPRAGLFESGDNQHLLLECPSQNCPRDIIVEVRNRVLDIIERLIEHLDPRRIPLTNPTLKANYGGEQTLMSTIHRQLNNLDRESSSSYGTTGGITL